MREVSTKLIQDDPGKSTVQMTLRMAQRRTVNQRRLVRAVVVQNQMHVQFGGSGRRDRVQGLGLLEGASRTMTLANDFAADHRQGGKKRRGASATA